MKTGIYVDTRHRNKYGDFNIYITVFINEKKRFLISTNLFTDSVPPLACSLEAKLLQYKQEIDNYVQENKDKSIKEMKRHIMNSIINGVKENVSYSANAEIIKDAFLRVSRIVSEDFPFIDTSKLNTEGKIFLRNKLSTRISKDDVAFYIKCVEYLNKKGVK